MPLNLSDIAKVEKNKIAGDGVWLVLLEILLNLPDGENLALRVVRNNEDILWNGLNWVAFPFDLDEVSEDAMGEIPQLTVKVSNVTRTVQRYVEEAHGGVGATVKLYVVHLHNLDDNRAEIEETFTVRSVKCDAYWVYFTLSGDYPTLRRIPETRYLKDFCPFQYKGLECGYRGDRAVYLDTNRFTILYDQTKRYESGNKILLLADSGTVSTEVVNSKCEERVNGDKITVIQIAETQTVPADIYEVEHLSCNKTLLNCRKRNNNHRFGGEPAIPDSGVYRFNL